MRRIYKEKNGYLQECLYEVFGDRIEIFGASGSTYISVSLNGVSTDEVKQNARRGGVKLLSMNSFNVKKDNQPLKNDRLVIGFGDLTREKIKLGVQLWKNSLI